MSTYDYYQPRRKAAKETWIAYVLWLLVGQFGIHKFYLEQNFSGIVYLVLGGLGWLMSPILIGYFLLVPLWIALLFDLFTIPGRVRQVNTTY